MSYRPHAARLIPILALGALLVSCRDAERSFAPGEGPEFSLTESNSLKGTIAFHSNRDGDFDIYVMNADGSGVTQLTHNDVAEFLPLWSPDGNRLTFGRCDAVCHVVVINADGSGERVLIDDGFPGAWSPNGKQIAFERTNGIYVMNADGSGVTQVADHDGIFGWSRDGKQLLIGGDRDGDFEISVLNLDGSGVTQLTDNTVNDMRARWSPNGQRIAFDSDRDGGDPDIFIMNADGTGVTQLSMNDVTDIFPAWSPDGKQIAFNSDPDGDDEIYVMNTDGSGLIQLTFNDGVSDGGPAWTAKTRGNDRGL